MTKRLDELDRDALKTSAKAFGNRAKDAMKSAAGSLVGGGHEAQGRLSVRIMADRMMKGWLTYKGASGQNATRDTVYQFLKSHYGHVIDDAKLRTITDMPPAVAPPAATPAAPAGAQPAPTTALPGAAQPATAPAATPAQPAAIPAPTVAPAVATPPAANPAPALATPAPAATPEPAAEPASPPAQPPRIRTIAQIEQEDNVSPGRAEKIQQQEIANRADFQTAQRAKVAAATSAATSAATPAATPIEPPQPSSQKSVPQEPPSEPETPDAPATPADPAVPTPAAGVNWNEFRNQLGSMLKQPQTDSRAAMMLIANTLKKTEKGSQDREKMVDLLRNLQNNNKVVAKIPELQQVALEGRQANGTLLREADANDVLPRSVLDQIFMKTAQTLVVSGQGNDQQRQSEHPWHSQDAHADEDEDEDDPASYNKKNMKLRDLEDELKFAQASPDDMRKGGTAILELLKKMLDDSKFVTLEKLKQAYRKAGKNINRLPTPVKQAMIQAAKAGT